MRVQQEPDNLPRRTVLAVTALAILITAGGVLAAWLLANHSAAALGGRELLRPPPQPMPSEVDAVEMRRFDERATMHPPPPSHARTDLERWHWANRRAQTVHPPIDAAIDLYLAREREQQEAP